MPTPATEYQLLLDQNQARGQLADRLHKVPLMVYSELRARGEREALLPLLESDDLGARLAAGVHALDFAPTLGEAALNAIADAPDEANLSATNRTSARMTIWRWRRGLLTYPDFSEE
jgi:hypothetical protein